MRRFRRLQPWAAVVLMVTTAAVAITGCGSTAAATSRPTAAPAAPATCSHKAPPRTLPAERWIAARQWLAPSGAGAIRLCRYSGLNAHPRLTLVGSQLLTGPGLVGQLVSEFDQLPSLHGAVACPADDGSQILTRLAYPGGRDVMISVGLAGCEAVTNGSVHRTAAGMGSPRAFGPQLVTQLEHLAGGRSSGVPGASCATRPWPTAACWRFAEQQARSRCSRRLRPRAGPRSAAWRSRSPASGC